MLSDILELAAHVQSRRFIPRSQSESDSPTHTCHGSQGDRLQKGGAVHHDKGQTTWTHPRAQPHVQQPGIVLTPLDRSHQPGKKGATDRYNTFHQIIGCPPNQ